MSERRKLVAGIAQEAPPTPQERKFVFGAPPQPHRRPVHAPVALPRTPVTTRIREDYARTLKRISLQRQMEGTEPNTLQDILEEAIEAWLLANGELARD